MKEPQITSDRQAFWKSSICECRAHIHFDVESPALHAEHCDDDHKIWCTQVATENLLKKKLQVTKPKQAALDNILRWKDEGVFMRTTFLYAANGLYGDQCYWDWDSLGVSLPKRLEDPERLSDLLQAKRNREFTIDQWMEHYWGTFERDGKTLRFRDEYPIFPEEYLCHPGMDETLFETLFKRKPEPALIKMFAVGKGETL
jgi:hypothetical protein